MKDVDEDDAETDEDAMGQTSDVEPGDEGDENEEEDTGEEDLRRSRIIPSSSGADTRVQVKYSNARILNSFEKFLSAVSSASLGIIYLLSESSFTSVVNMLSLSGNVEIRCFCQKVSFH